MDNGLGQVGQGSALPSSIRWAFAFGFISLLLGENNYFSSKLLV